MRVLKPLDDFLMALAVVVFADLVLFHFGAYYPLLQPSSHSGEVARQERRLTSSHQAHPGRNRIVAMGNSITVACIQETQLEAELAKSQLPTHVVNMAIGSSTPRSWLLLLDNGRVTPDNTAMVILGLNPSSIQASSNDLELRDLKISKTHLRVSDALTMARTYAASEMQMIAASRAVFRSPLFREDLRQYLEAPRERHLQLAARASGKAAGNRRENRWQRHLSAARLGDDGKLVFEELPSFLKKKHRLRANIERSMQLQARASGRKPHRAPEVDARQAETLSRLVERLNAKRIKVVFSVVPRSPYPTGPLNASGIEALHDALRQSGADVAFWHDPELIATIEAPEFYRDRLHVNAKGAKLYSRGLARFLTTLLPGTSKLEV